ncbi:MAG: TorF family putative porin [Pseudomonadales bacterium]|nr:TorF family putative porin [Pseudomonadales bacterium]
MKSTISKAVRLATLGLTVAGAMAISQTTMAEVDVSASAGVASAYLFRGVDLGAGNAAVFGDITASAGGAYASVWASSGDAVLGSEYDLILGYGIEMGDFSIDAGVVNYLYPSDGASDSIGDFSEVYLNIGFGAVGFSYVDNVAGGSGYEYYTLSGDVGSFSALVGYADSEEASGSKVDLDYTHIDLSYAYNDNLSFTASKIVDFDDDSTPNAAIDDDLLFVVSYSLPIK